MLTRFDQQKHIKKLTQEIKEAEAVVDRMSNVMKEEQNELDTLNSVSSPTHHKDVTHEQYTTAMNLLVMHGRLPPPGNHYDSAGHQKRRQWLALAYTFLERLTCDPVQLQPLLNVYCDTKTEVDKAWARRNLYVHLI